MAKMIPVGIKFTRAMLVTLRTQAAQEDITLGEFVRRALGHYLEQKEASRK